MALLQGDVKVQDSKGRVVPPFWLAYVPSGRAVGSAPRFTTRPNRKSYGSFRQRTDGNTEQVCGVKIFLPMRKNTSEVMRS
jgi:hypothetical protein